MEIFTKTMISLSIKDALKFPDEQGLWEQGLEGWLSKSALCSLNRIAYPWYFVEAESCLFYSSRG